MSVPKLYCCGTLKVHFYITILSVPTGQINKTATYIEINSAIKKCIDTHSVGRLAIGDGLELRIGRNGKAVWWVRKKKAGKLVSKNLG